jgi:hypothetical protein
MTMLRYSKSKYQKGIGRLISLIQTTVPLPDGLDKAGAGVEHLLVHLQLLARVVGPACRQQLRYFFRCLKNAEEQLIIEERAGATQKIGTRSDKPRTRKKKSRISKQHCS